jgi:predicted XRE-type DNA-binding protein
LGRWTHEGRLIVLLELAAANAAYAVIKETIGNGRDLMDAASALSQWFDSKNSLQKKANEKGGVNRSDLEEFAALEKLKQQEEDLKRMMIYSGRGGLWDDWLKFQSDAKRKREEAEKEKIRRKQRIIGRIKDGFMILLIVALLGGLGAIIGFAIWYARDV